MLFNVGVDFLPKASNSKPLHLAFRLGYMMLKKLSKSYEVCVNTSWYYKYKYSLLNLRKYRHKMETYWLLNDRRITLYF